MSTAALPADHARPRIAAEWIWAATAAVAFHIAYEFPPLALPSITLYLYALIRLTQVPTARRAFYSGLAAGLACIIPQLWFFWGIFHFTAIALWLLLSLWIALFTLIGWHLRQVERIPAWLLPLLLAIIWTGLEYFRSELYYLKFAWLTPGFALGNFADGQALLSIVGVYGAGFVLTALAAILSILPRHITIKTAFALWIALWFVGILPSLAYSGPALFAVAIQLESPSESQVLAALDHAAAADSDRHPSPNSHSLLVMSEYTLTTPPPQSIRDWCRSNQYYLLIGGIQPLGPTPDGTQQWSNTAFVIDPKGEIVFTQCKSVPIQFFDDGQPAKEQKIWHSPWGDIAICICYDLSYSRVTDKLITQGASALIVIAMDAMSWGEHEHTLHAKIAPARALEYHLDILRVASSGVTQWASRHGGVRSIPFPNQGATMYATLQTRTRPHLPPDRYLAPVCVAISTLLAIGLLGRAVRRPKYAI